MTGAQRWALILDPEMTAQGMSNTELDRLAGVAPGRTWSWRSGKTMPTPENARIVADLLANEYLWISLVATRTKSCEIDGREFMDVSTQMNARYCGALCRKVALARKRRRSSGDQLRFSNARLERALRAIAKHCKACEPEGVCRDAHCNLQRDGVSPFRLVARKKTA